ncbi:rab11 family-interacting protein 2 [Sitodiplosis mosellana]|uniref:rab11 family-interacting protein 2 n=1 Tax=Sitodiplosis mosellana TaxID=263140 RepID=UPI0024449277|nr:rab11 family-interacting protein 2 [Sitodiplosis mosellana]XP_055302623.1 rab11 family-interacting protein 2 [Sitodiplosis mosellana]XP_055302624.1 rab11 family-interacting protein 2 [Sitodiplosis mosellana]XP_055302625.1 rab11 family-interacting protein 2 [Sitodiplosis mosellana]XP_055302626.1 rab11 family-interacting protein 2 [Sitodiplosis mosellana]XP_055302627.1 rab11 family-interacting protein 2 [Sitodiplosis mosellana]XP_055302628.1 rab11 family-interacting protein 2 [Sitodiplosis m
MWSPTHIQVTVLNAKGVLTKGKNGTNNCFVTIALGKEKYQTSIKEKATQNVEWREECELTIPERGNRAELILTCLHRNNLGMDEFLGQVTLPLNEMDAYERPRARWYKLQSKPGKEKKHKDRGELEARVAFTVKAGSLTDLSKKEKNKSSTLGLGGSLLSLNTLEKRKSLKKFAKSIGSKMHITGKKKDKDTDSISSSISSLSMTGSNRFDDRRFEGTQARGDADPGVISEDEDEFAFDNLSNKSSASSINLKSKTLQSTPLAPSPLVRQSYSFANVNTAVEDEPPKITETPQKPEVPKRQSLAVDEWEAKLYGKNVGAMSDSLKRRSWEPQKRVEQSNPFEEDQQEAKQQAPHSNPFDEEVRSNPFEETSHDDIIENVADKMPENTYELSSTLPRETAHKEKKEKSEKRFANKLKYFRKDKHNDTDDSHSNKNTPNQQQRQFSERIIIGHENDILGHKSVEVPPVLMKKYEGKSREEMILLANTLENEVKLQKNKMKEMEDYLDNLLLRVMETHPKILQNPYRTQSSVKSG